MERRPIKKVKQGQMVEFKQLCGLLANEGRRAVLWTLAQGSRDVTTVTETLGYSTSRVSHYLNELFAHDLVEFSIQGRHRVYRLGPCVRALRFRSRQVLEFRTPDGCVLTLATPPSMTVEPSAPQRPRRNVRGMRKKPAAPDI